MSRSVRVRCRSNAVCSVAVCANRNVRIAVRELDAVNAGLVLLKLICAQRRTVLLHLACVRMTRAAECRDLTAPNCVVIRFPGLVNPLVAADASQPFLRVNI